jgi:Flp pilus assembly protein TadG
MRNMTMTDSHDRTERGAGMLLRGMATRRDAGQALLEVALAMPVFILLLVGTAEFGRLAYAGIEVSNAARAAVQYGAQSHTTASDTAGMQQAALNDGPDVTSLTATPTHFCGCSNGAASTCLATDCSGARIIEYVQVNTSAQVATLFHYPGIAPQFTLRGQAIMRVEQ